ncbi:MAG TPA: sporulation peptidase YabG [Sedimentibacter sp.]|nr:sporulation peptidase YabG [Sedimentibacter sp.]
MNTFRVGDIVARKSYGMDIFFKILEIEDDKVMMKGLNYRLIADAPKDDLVLVPETLGNKEEIHLQSI